MSQSEQSFRARISRLFRERELYVRSDGHIRYITLKPYMLVMVVGVLITILTTGIVGSVSYFLARNSLFAFRENLNKTTDTYKFRSNKTFADTQKAKISIPAQVTAELTIQKNKHERELKKLRDAYEQQLARFQSSLSQVNGRLVKNQLSYKKELESLRSVYGSLQKRQIVLEDQIDQGWAPRMVTLPETSQPKTSDKKSGNNLKKLNKIEKTQSKKNSSLSPDTFNTIKDPSAKIAQASSRPSSLKPMDIASLKSSMEEQWKKQNRASAQINFSARKRANELVQILTRLKFKLSKLKLPLSPGRQNNTGGPFVELAFAEIASNSKKFENVELATQQTFTKISMLEEALIELPVRRPLSDLRSITSPFGPRLDPFRKLYAMHRGIDFRAPMGEPVLATADGVVVLAQNNSKAGFGKMLVIRHKFGITTLYGHLSKFSVKAGDRVKAGDVVGKVGNTGRSTGPHLHYGIRVGDSHVDPIDYLEAAAYVF